MTARSDRRIALLAGGLLALLLTGFAAVLVAGWSVGSVQRTSRHVIHRPVRKLRVDAGHGDITIVPARGGDVTIFSRVEGSLHVPRLRTSVNGTDVSLSGGCPPVGFGRCRTTIMLHVPAATAVRVHSSSGDIAARGIAAPVRLVTGSGDVSASGLSGGAELESASGDVEAAELRAGSVRARSASGDVELGFAGVPDAVDAETSSGDVRVMLPHGDEAYRVETDSDSGDREIGVRTDPSSPRVIRARTSAGDAIVRYEP